MPLSELIGALEAADPATVVPDGFRMPHSYRGYYNDVAFEPARNVTVAHMLGAAREALGSTYEGWKGGEYTMREDTDCWLAFEGTCGEELTADRLRDMLAAGHGQDGQADEVERLRGELAEAREQVKRVRELHAPITVDGRTICSHCVTYDGQSVAHPCPTMVDLDGTEAS